MDIAGDDVCEARVFGAGNRVLGQQRRIGVSLVEIFDDGQRLDQHLADSARPKWHAHLRVHRAEFRPSVMATVFHEMHRYRLVGEPLRLSAMRTR